MPAQRFVLPYQSVVNGIGVPISGARLNFYVTGTSTRLDTYSNEARTIPNTNPVIADAAGRFGNIFLASATYKVVLTDANDVEIWTADPVVSASTVDLGDLVAVGAMPLTAWQAVSTVAGVMDIGSAPTNMVRSQDTSNVTSLGVATAGAWRFISCESNRLFVHSGNMYFLDLEADFRSGYGDMIFAHTNDGTHWDCWSRFSDGLAKRYNVAPSLGAGDYYWGWGENLFTRGPDFAIAQNYDQTKIGAKSIVMMDANDTPEVGMWIAAGTQAAPVKWNEGYPGAFVYGWPIVDNSGNTANTDPPYNNSENIGRNATVNFPVDGVNLGTHSTPGAIELGNCAVNMQVPKSNAFSTMVGGWVFQGQTVQDAIAQAAITYPWNYAQRSRIYSPVAGINWEDFDPDAALTVICNGLDAAGLAFRYWDDLVGGFGFGIDDASDELRISNRAASVMTNRWGFTSTNADFLPVSNRGPSIGSLTRRVNDVFGDAADFSTTTNRTVLKIASSNASQTEDLAQFDTPGMVGSGAVRSLRGADSGGEKWSIRSNGLGVFAAINLGETDLNIYEEGTWTPTFTFVTPGDLSVVYGTRVGTYTRIGNSVQLRCQVAPTPTYTTASGAARFSGLPFSINANLLGISALAHNANLAYSAGVTAVVVVATSTTTLGIKGLGTGATADQGVTQMPTATAQDFLFSLEYQV